MRKITALILMIALLAVCIAPAFADRPVPDDGYVPKREWRLSQGKGAYYLSQSSSYSDSETWENGSWSSSGTETFTGTFGGNRLTELVYTNDYSNTNTWTYEGQTESYSGSGTYSYRMTGQGTVLEYTDNWTTDDGESGSTHYTFDGTHWYNDDGIMRVTDQEG